MSPATSLPGATSSRARRARRGAGHVELGDALAGVVGGQLGAAAAEGVGLDDVGARLEVRAVDAADDVGIA